MWWQVRPWWAAAGGTVLPRAGLPADLLAADTGATHECLCQSTSCTLSPTSSHNYGGHQSLPACTQRCARPGLAAPPAGDMNWVSMRGEDVPWPLPPGWQDVWLALRPRERGWTWDTSACPQKGRKYKDGVRACPFLTNT